MSASATGPLTAPERLVALRRSFGWTARQGPRRGKLARYLLAGGLALGGVWSLTAGYLVLMPKTWTSSFTFVLPGTGAGSSLNVPSIGQATTGSISPFSSPDMSPTENYRRMLMSHRTMVAAAKLADEDPDRFPVPRVELVDQTKLITVKMQGRTPEQARARAAAVQSAFLDMLDALRSDEIAMRDQSARATLNDYRIRVGAARRRLIAHEARSGLASVEQYNGLVASVDRLRQAQGEAEGKLAQAQGEQAELARVLGTNAEGANRAMVLHADPTFQALLTQGAKQDTELAMLAGTRDTGNPKIAEIQAERSSVQARLQARLAELTGIRQPGAARGRDLSLHDERARLFERLLTQASDTEALSALVAHLRQQTLAERDRVAALADDASMLDELRHDVEVAEAVFSSALARVDTSKADFYASYPLLQTLETPDSPDRPSSPTKLLAAAGGAAASLLILMILALSWLRATLLGVLLDQGRGTAVAAAEAGKAWDGDEEWDTPCRAAPLRP